MVAAAQQTAERTNLMSEFNEPPIPPQRKSALHYDFRHAATAPHGVKWSGKRKLEECAEQVAADEAESAMLDDDLTPQKPAKKSKCQPSRVSGKRWKAVAMRMSATGNRILNTSWEQKMKVKAEAALFKTQKDEARAEKKAQLTSEWKRREIGKQRKTENQKAALAVTGQAITNNSTLRRMMKSKKARKKLVQV